MIRLKNDHEFEYMIASGALGFDGRGWLWEWPLVWLGLIKPKLFTIVLRTLTRHPRLYPTSNLSWIRPWTWLPWSPWSCVRLLPDGGTVNKIGLYNPGIEWWCSEVGPHLDYTNGNYVASIFGNENELVEMTHMLNKFRLTASEVNYSCPNMGTGIQATQAVIKAGKAVRRHSVHPVIMKVSVKQDYLMIARELEGVVDAISLNSVPWETMYPDGEVSPLTKLEQRVGGGGGGVSGKPAQKWNWRAVEELARQKLVPVIAPSIMEYEDLDHVRRLGASAISFGAIHLPTHGKPWTTFTNPCKPTTIVERDMYANDWRW